MDRVSTLERKTNETDVKISLNLDGTGVYSVETGIGFFDHMLTGFAKHGFFDLSLMVNGDLLDGLARLSAGQRGAYRTYGNSD